MTKRPRRNPFRGVMDLMSEMSRMSDQMAGQDTPRTHGRSYADAWTPNADMLSRGDDLIIRIELPGVLDEDLEVTMSDGLLGITGERRATDDEAAYYFRERYWGWFRRTIRLSADVTHDQIGAHLEDGVLEITVRRGALAGPRAIRVTGKRRRSATPE